MIAFTRVGSWYTTFIVFCFSLCIQLNLASEAIATEFLATPPPAQHNPDCITTAVPGITTAVFYDSHPYKGFTKNWSLTDDMNKHLVAQKDILKALNNHSLVSEPVHSIRFSAVGDIMKIPSPQKNYVDSRLNAHLEKSDVVVGNLETLISPAYPVPTDSLFKMNSDPSVLSAFQRSDGSNIFSALSLANNHTFDYPDQAIHDTLDYLKQHDIQQTGIQQTNKPYAVIEKNAIRIGYYALTTFINNSTNFAASKIAFNPLLQGIAKIPYEKWTNTCDLNYNPIKQVLAAMDSDNIDFKVISIHWGYEQHMYPQPQQLQIAREIMRQGWDVIIGSHSHTIQPAEVCFFNGYEKSLPDSIASQSAHQCRMNTSDGIPRKSIAYYSLGNFTSYTQSIWSQLGVIAELEIEKDAQGHVDWHSPKYTYTYDHSFHPPDGKQFLTLFDQQGIQCPWDFCINELDEFLDIPKQHMEGAGFSFSERMRLIWISGQDAVKALWYWVTYKE